MPFPARVRPVKIALALCLSRDAATVAVVRHLVTGALRDLAVDDEHIDDIVLALSEACSNVIRHSGVEDDYDVHVEIDGDRWWSQVSDAGRGPEDIPLESAGPDTLALGGRGLAIMRAVMDGVIVKPAPAGGTLVELVKCLRRGGPSAAPAGQATDRSALRLTVTGP